ncbi:MAG: ornithine cyclodeaminase family protein, partial [Candidatus Limnocylindria bacterium]
VQVEAASAEDAVAGADVVVTATTSRVPVFEGRGLSPGAHVTAVGAFTPDTRELDAETMRATVFVDHRASALAEAGELRDVDPTRLWEIGDVAAGRVPGRSRPDERTVFKSVGNAIQDLVVAARVYEVARALGLGEDIAFP